MKKYVKVIAILTGVGIVVSWVMNKVKEFNSYDDNDIDEK